MDSEYRPVWGRFSRPGLLLRNSDSLIVTHSPDLLSLTTHSKAPTTSRVLAPKRCSIRLRITRMPSNPTKRTCTTVNSFRGVEWS
jgi:hypothetical protein